MSVVAGGSPGAMGRARVARSLERGLTLIELMVVVVIVGILAGIAYPSYTAYVERARRTDGTGALLDVAQRLERCYTQNNTYVGCAVPAASPDGFYAIAAPTQDAGAFTLTATPQGVHAGDTGCGTLSLTSNGTRGRSGTLPVERCW